MARGIVDVIIWLLVVNVNTAIWYNYHAHNMNKMLKFNFHKLTCL